MVQAIRGQFIRSLNGIFFVALIGTCGSAFAGDCADPKSAANPRYDASGRIIATSDANGGLTTYKYDQAGGLVACADTKGVVTQFKYDTNGRRIRETVASVPTAAKQ